MELFPPSTPSADRQHLGPDLGREGGGDVQSVAVVGVSGLWVGMQAGVTRSPAGSAG